MDAEAWLRVVTLLATVFGIVRAFAVVAGIWFQALVTVQRYHERQRVCSDPDSPLIECAIQQWHYERGCMLMAVHVLLLLLSVLALVVRASTPLDQIELSDLAARMVADLLFTLIVVVLALVSIRARYHHRRVLSLIGAHSDGLSAVAQADHEAVTKAVEAAEAIRAAAELHQGGKEE